VPEAPAPARTTPREVTLPEPPEMPPQSADLDQEPPAQPAEKLPPAPRRTRGSRSVRVRETAEQPAEPAPAQQEEAAPVPQLEQILSPEQRQTYLDEIEANIGRAQRTVDSVQRRRLSAEQRTDLARIREFIVQAKEARKTDLFRARNLAERAGILAEDLNRSVQ
jgi:hypothetical protein